MGTLGGALKPLTAPDLAAAVLTRLLAGQDPARLGAILLGQAIQAGAGPNPAARAAALAGFSPAIPGFTLNQGTASGLQAVFQGLHLAAANPEQILVAGGMESSSQAPYLLPTARWGTRMGAAPILDALFQDGLPEARALSPAAVAWAESSRSRCRQSRQASAASEITPVTVPERRGSRCLSEDPGDPSLDGPARPGDGAAGLLLAAAQPRSGPPALARIRATAVADGCAAAIGRVLAETGLSLGEIDRIQLDEAEPERLLELLAGFPELDPARLNPRGGALGLGLAAGAPGAHMLVTLTHQLRDHGLAFGLAALEAQGCGLALLVENL